MSNIQKSKTELTLQIEKKQQPKQLSTLGKRHSQVERKNEPL